MSSEAPGRMSRTVELGRAVLSISEPPSQLWLTTLITISLQHDSLDLQQYNRPELLKFLLSREVWVCRGHGMQLALNITLYGEPLGTKERDDLAESIVDAPVGASSL
jgi:hypothetical protein